MKEGRGKVQTKSQHKRHAGDAGLSRPGLPECWGSMGGKGFCVMIGEEVMGRRRPNIKT